MSKWFSVQPPRNQPSLLNCLRRRFMHDAPVAPNKYTFLAPFNDVGGSGDNPGKNRGSSIPILHVPDAIVEHMWVSA